MKSFALPLLILVCVQYLQPQSQKEDVGWSTYAGIASFATATALAFRYDQTISDELSNWKEQSSFLRTVSPFFTTAGNGAVVAGALGGFGLYAYCTGDTTAFTTAFTATTAFLVSGAAGILLKHSFGRERPFVASRPNGFWHGPYAYFIPSKRNGKPVDAFDSFPSGHTISSFCVATVFADAYKDTYVPYISYSLATLIMISRVTEREHWLSDCLVGAAIGYAGAKLTQRWLRSTSPYRILPLLSSHGIGLVWIAEL